MTWLAPVVCIEWNANRLLDGTLDIAESRWYAAPGIGKKLAGHLLSPSGCP